MAFEEETSIIDVRLKEGGFDKNGERTPTLLVLAGSQVGKTYKLGGGDTVIGRSAEAAIQIEDDGVSRKHALIHFGTDTKILIRDMGSTNGTFCNGERVTERVLVEGDKLQIGTTTILKLVYQDTLEEDFQRKQYESATRDGLTSCFNKRYFLERLPAELSFARRHKKALALAMIDIDHFKNINDTLGHEAGDQVLAALAVEIKKAIRASDVLCRYGGEEFALIMRETLVESAFAVAERIRRRIEGARFSHDGNRIPVTISVGVAVTTTKDPMTGPELVKNADSYLYKAKRDGRNRTECKDI